MNKNAIIGFINNVASVAEEHLPTILMVVGTGLFGATIAKAVEEAPAVQDEVLKATDEKGEGLTPVETTLIAVKGYRGAIGLGVSSLACFYAAHGINSRRLLALASAYSMKDAMFEKYTDATEKIVGKNKARKIKAMAGEEALREDLGNNTPIENTKYGNTLFYIPELHRLFRSDMEHVKSAFGKADSYMHRNNEVCVNYLLDCLGLMPFGKIGNWNGWKLETVYRNSGNDIARTKILTDEDIDACLIDDQPYIQLDIMPEPLVRYTNDTWY